MPKTADICHSLKYLGIPLKRLVFASLNREVEFRYPDNAYWKADQKQGYNIAYSDPIVSYVDGTFVRKDRMPMENDDIKTLGTVLGFTPSLYLKLIKSGKIQLLENSNRHGLLRQIENGRIDGGYMSVVVANYQLSLTGKRPATIVFAKHLPFKKSSYHLSSILRPLVIEEFNDFLKNKKTLIDDLKTQFQVEKGIMDIP